MPLAGYPPAVQHTMDIVLIVILTMLLIPQERADRAATTSYSKSALIVLLCGVAVGLSLPVFAAFLMRPS